VKLGDEKSLEIVGKGEMKVPTKKVTMKVMDIYYDSNLKQILLSIGQMHKENYKLVFEDRMCKIYDKNHDERLVTTIQMTTNKLFPVKFLELDGGFIFVGIENKNALWHIRLGNLNF